jgi:hypothetical protein
MRNSLIVISAVMTACVMGNCPFAQGVPSQTGPNVSRMVSHSSVWTWPFEKPALSKSANNGPKTSEVWTWPVSKEARSPVWTEARSLGSNGSSRSSFDKSQTARWRNASLKSVSLGGL